jgi:hypothetical protein
MRVRPNRRTWIYGRAAKGTSKIYYPPVVPWIRPALLDDMTELFLQAAMKGSGTLETERAGLLGTISDLESRAILSPVERRHLHKSKKRVAEIEAELTKSKDKFADKAQAEALNFCLLRGIRQVHVVEREDRGFLHMVTAPVKIDRALLGTYDIWIDPRRGTPGEAVKLIRRDKIRREGPHPHWDHGPCFGTWGPLFLQFMRRKSWSALAGGMLNYLAIYDKDSPLILIDDFYTGAKYENQKPLE